MYFPKPGKDCSGPASYSPICTLPTLRKVLDKMCLAILVLYLKASGLLVAQQYAFWKTVSTVDKLRRVMEFIAESKKCGEFTCLFTLDIKSAFNSVRITDILRFLEEPGVETYLLGLIVPLVPIDHPFRRGTLL